MSTRSRIGVLEADGTVTSIYCHYDGYLSGAGVGATLLEHYGPNRTRRLLARGCIRQLFQTPERCDAYGTTARRHKVSDWPDTGQSYEYLLRGSLWYYRRTWPKRPRWHLVTERNTK